MQTNTKFDIHAEKLLQSSTDIFARLNGIRRAKWDTSSALAKVIYKLVYIPRLTYGAEIWYPRLNASKEIR